MNETVTVAKDDVLTITAPEGNEDFYTVTVYEEEDLDTAIKTAKTILTKTFKAADLGIADLDKKNQTYVIKVTKGTEKIKEFTVKTVDLAVAELTTALQTAGKKAVKATKVAGKLTVESNANGNKFEIVATDANVDKMTLAVTADKVTVTVKTGTIASDILTTWEEVVTLVNNDKNANKVVTLKVTDPADKDEKAEVVIEVTTADAVVAEDLKLTLTIGKNVTVAKDDVVLVKIDGVNYQGTVDTAIVSDGSADVDVTFTGTELSLVGKKVTGIVGIAKGNGTAVTVPAAGVVTE